MTYEQQSQQAPSQDESADNTAATSAIASKHMLTSDVTSGQMRQSLSINSRKQARLTAVFNAHLYAHVKLHFGTRQQNILATISTMWNCSYADVLARIVPNRRSLVR